MVSAYFALALFTIVQICIKSLEYRILNLVVDFRLSSLAAKVSLPFFHYSTHIYIIDSKALFPIYGPPDYLLFAITLSHISFESLQVITFPAHYSRLLYFQGSVRSYTGTLHLSSWPHCWHNALVSYAATTRSFLFTTLRRSRIILLNCKHAVLIYC